MRWIIGGMVLWMLAGCTAWKARTVQTTVRESSQCTALRVSELNDGWRVEGCDASWFCQGINGPCEQRSCEDWEMVTYNKCIEHASRGGLSWGQQLANAMMADTLISECRLNHDRALDRCSDPHARNSSSTTHTTPASM